MSKRIAVIATKAKFKELRKFFRKSFPFPLDSSTDNYLSVIELHFYRLDNPKHLDIYGYNWNGFIDLVGWDEMGSAFANIQKDLIDCIDAMEEKGVGMWNTAKVCREIEQSVPF